MHAKFENVLGPREVAQLAHTKIGENDVVAQRVDDEFSRRARAQDLSARGQRPQARGAVDRSAEVVAITQFDLACVQRHADAQRFAQCPLFMGDRVLQLHGRCGCRRRPVEDRERGVAFAARFDQPPATRRHNLLDELVVARESRCHRLGVGLPCRRRPLDIGQQESHRSGDARRLLCLRRIQCGILGDDRALETPKFGARVDAQLIGQQGSCPLIRAERFTLSARSVEREHQLAPTPFAKWCVGDRGLEFADDLGGPARRKQRIRPVLDQGGMGLDPTRLL